MQFLLLLTLLGALSPRVVTATQVTSALNALPTPFTSGFQQPAPPVLPTEISANWNQHKWNVNLSHIASGYLYNSPLNKKVRADLTADGQLGSSLFDYTKVNDEGVYNILWTLSPAVASTPTVYTGYQNPGFPLIESNLLVENDAVYAGVQNDPYVGEVVAWNILYQGQIPTTVYLGANNIPQGYDFWATNQRTYVITRFFNIVIGEIASDVFVFPNASSSRAGG